MDYDLRKWGTAALGLAVGAACVASAAPEAPRESGAASLAIRDVTVIPMTGGAAASHRTVLIEGGRISAIVAAGDAIPAGTAVIEGGGRFLFPGLIDAHVHLRRSDAPSYVADGVLTVRNMWGHSGIRPLIDAIGRGDVVGPAVVSLSPGIDGSPPQWPETELLNAPGDAEAIVARLAGAGWPTLKVYQGLSLASFDAVVASARKHQVEFAGHVPTAVPIEHALDAGMRSIEHFTGYDRRLSASHNGGTWGWGDAKFDDAAALVSRTVASSVWNVPTLTIYSTLAKQHPAEMRERVIANRRRFVAMLASAGAHLAAGTDAGIDIIPASGSLLAELREFEAAGLSRTAVLALATSRAGELLRVPGLGTIAPGAPARLLLLDADPTSNLSALQAISASVLDGRLMMPSSSCARTSLLPANPDPSMRFAPLRYSGLAAASIVALGCGSVEGPPLLSLDGSYNTAVSVTSTSAGCTLPVQQFPTVVQTSNNNTVVTLTHAGTSYTGALKSDLSFTTQTKTAVFDGVSYAMVVTGKFIGTTLDATISLDYGTAPACHVVVRWAGPKA